MIITFLDIVIIMLTVAVSNITEKPMMIMTTLTMNKTMMIKTTKVRLMLWDTAGQEEFDALTKAYYRGAQVIVIVIAIINISTHEHDGYNFY